MSGYIYAIHVREFIRTHENIIKIGRTEDIIQRFGDYPKGSRLLYTIYVSDQRQAEYNLIISMRQHFINRRDIGREYFQGNITTMIQHMMQTVSIPVDHFAPLPLLPQPKKEIIKDTDVIIRLFMEEYKERYEEKVVKSSQFYDDFMLWKKDQQAIQKSISHKRFSSGLKELYGAKLKSHRFDDGVHAAIYIEGPNRDMDMDP